MGGDGPLSLREPVLWLDPLFQRGCQAVPAAPGCSDPTGACPGTGYVTNKI